MKTLKDFKIFMDLFLLISASIMFAFQSISAQQPTLTWLGTLGGNISDPYGVSADGAVVVGVSDNTSGSPRAFKWTASGGMEDLGTFSGGDWSEATGISADGSVIVGWSWDSMVYRAFRWTITNGMQDLGVGEFSRAQGISSDGIVIVGWRIDSTYERAFSWTASGGVQDLGTLGGDNSAATAVSSDGSVVVGRSNDITGDPYAFRWTAGDSMVQIGTFYSFALGVSGDGATVTGFETGSAGFYRAFRWTLSSGFEFSIAGNFSAGNGVSGNGSIIVGYNGGGAFRLSTTGVLEDLDQVYANLLTAGSNLWNAQAISPDGRFIVGSGYNAATGRDEAFLLDTEGPNSIDRTESVPTEFKVYQNYPNPFNPITDIQYTIPQTEQVKLEIYNSLGEKVAELENELKPAGQYQVQFDATQMPSGIYFCHITAGRFQNIMKMILMK